MTPGPRPLRRSTPVRVAALLLIAVGAAPAQNPTDAGIPVTDRVVLARCGTCHTADPQGNLQSISWSRTTPEGWQAIVLRMIRQHDVTLTPAEARDMVRYFSTRHGLAPEESKPVMYYAERRVRDEVATLDASLVESCGRCHEAARALSWRRTADGWKTFAASHATRQGFEPSPAAIAVLATAAPFSSPEWASWSTKTQAPSLSGRWLVTAHVQGRGRFAGEMHVESAGGDDLSTRLRLRAVDDGAVVERTGRSVVYGGTAWRGRSRGASAASVAPDDLSTDAREVMWVAADGSRIEGRWFWGQYDELGFDVTMQRPADGAALLLVDPPAIKAGTSAARVRLIGERFPASVTPADLDLGPGVTVRRILSASPGEVVAEVNASADAAPGPRTVSLGSSRLDRALAIYDRVDYVKVTPESSLATFGNEEYARGVQPFEAVGYQRGPDGKPRTADDLEIGPVPVRWSMEVFYETDPAKQDRVGSISPTGLFTPAAVNPGTNFDVWIVATATADTEQDGKPLVGKGYLVVTVPTYTFEGRTYVRDLGRWVETGSAR